MHVRVPVPNLAINKCVEGENGNDDSDTGFDNYPGKCAMLNNPGLVGSDLYRQALPKLFTYYYHYHYSHYEHFSYYLQN